MVNHDRGVYGSQLVEALSGDYNIELISQEQGMERLKKKRIEEFYVIDEDFSESLQKGTNIEITVNRRVNTQNFSDFEMKAKDAIDKLIISVQIENAAGKKIPLDSLNADAPDIRTVSTKNSDEASQLVVNLLLSFILFTSIGMCFELFALKRERTLRRSLTTGNKPGMVIAGILGAYFVVVAVGYCLIFLANAFLNTKTLLHKAPIIVVNIVMLAAVALSLAVFVSRIVKNEKMIIVALQIVICGICFVGGSFVPLELLPKSFTFLSRFTPQFWAMESIETGRYEYSLIVLLFAVVLFTAGTVSARSFVDVD